MKAFIVAALLVASVAAQSMDLMDLTMKDKSLYKYRPTRMSTIEDLLLKEKMGSRRHMMDYTNINDMDSILGGLDNVNILSLEELVNIPLFREYMQIPLFRQFWEQHPTVFRRYVESPLFQKFFTVPQFQMYFRNPMFFYKYIVPQIQLVNQINTEGMFTPTYSRYTPYTHRYQPEEYSKWSLPISMTMGKMYNNLPYTSTTNYKYLLEKMMNHLNINKMGQDITETLTDVKMLPTGRVQENTFGSVVDPLSGLEKLTVGDIKMVDEKIVPVQSMDFPFGLETLNKKYEIENIFGHHNTESIKDLLLKHIILNKVMGHKRMLTPSVYETLFEDNKEIMTPEIFSTMYKNKNVMIPEMLETILRMKNMNIHPEMYETLVGKKVLTPEIFENVFGTKKTMTPEMYEILFGQNKHMMMKPETLETIFGKKIYTPEVYGTLFGEKTMMNIPEMYNKYNVDYEPFTLNKMINPLVVRMLKNNNKNIMYQPYTNDMDLTTLKAIKEKIQAEKIMENMQKEQMMGYNTIESLPNMMETKMEKEIKF